MEINDKRIGSQVWIEEFNTADDTMAVMVHVKPSPQCNIVYLLLS